jgi:hypothetical protein
MQKSDIKYIVVHATDWPENWYWHGRDREENLKRFRIYVKQMFSDMKERFESGNIIAADIHWYHKNILGWHGIGYHWCIERDGNLENGRPWYWKGAHVREYNYEAIGIALVGLAQYTNEQIEELNNLLWLLTDKYGNVPDFPNAEVCGHSDLDPSKPNCPGFSVKEWWEEVK